MAMEIVFKCSVVEFFQKNHVLKNNVNLDWVHCKHLFGNPTLLQLVFGVNELQSLIWTRHVKFTWKNQLFFKGTL